MRGIGFDPFCLEPQGRPEPVEGPLPPPIALVEEEDHPRLSPWRKWIAVGLIAVVAINVALRVAVFLDRLSPSADRAPAVPSPR